MIRDVVLHLANEQPLKADLLAMPGPGDAGFTCTNLRTMDGRRPVYIDRSESTFFFPFVHLRFLEIPQVAATVPALPAGTESPGAHPDPERARADAAFLEELRGG